MSSDNTSRVVLSLSIGTIFLVVAIAVFSALASIVISSSSSDPGSEPRRFPRLWSPLDDRRDPSSPSRPRSSDNRSNVDKFGPLNFDALEESKEGILDRWRAARAARLRPTSSTCYPSYVYHPVAVTSSPACVPCNQPPSNSIPAPTSSPACVPCNQPPSVSIPAPTGSTGSKPTTAPEQPLVRPTCPDGSCPPRVPNFEAAPRAEKKTGGFTCTSCSKLTVGANWQTTWTDDGTPITFVCRECWERLNPSQRDAVYRSWLARQQSLDRLRTDYPAR